MDNETRKLFVITQTCWSQFMLRTICAFIVLHFFNSCPGQGLVKIGDKVPPYRLDNIINGPVKDIELPSAKLNKPIVLIFWGTWCAPCIPEMANLANLQNT